ncbi:hypothetical protein V6N13_076181 [Hibiscus sabdariffa]
MVNPQFQKGMVFSGKENFEAAVREYGIKNRVDLKLKRTYSKRVHVICKEGCPWYIWASRVDPKDRMNPTWHIKSYNGEHKCMMALQNKNVTYKWLAKTYLEKYRDDPTYSSRQLKKDVMHDLVYKVSASKCLRARNLALEMVMGSHKGQYSMIYNYLGEIRTSNPGSTTIRMLDNRVFMRMYICLGACKNGYKSGCRPIISIDGYHLKGYFGGTFLAAVGVDVNDNIYPIAYAIVETESAGLHMLEDINTKCLLDPLINMLLIWNVILVLAGSGISLVKRPTSSPSETSPFVFILTPGLASHPTTQQSCPTQQPGSVMTVRLMATSQEHCSVDQSLSQSSTLTQNVQENNNNEGLRKRPRMV